MSPIAPPSHTHTTMLRHGIAPGVLAATGTGRAGESAVALGSMNAAGSTTGPSRVMELTLHEQAISEALRETVQKLVEEFDPEALKKRLLVGGPRIFESGRAWDAFARHYEEQAASKPAWPQQLLERYFAPAYARAKVRAKRNTPGPP